MSKAYLYAESAAGAAELVSLAAGLGRESVLFAVGAAGGMEAAGADRLVVLAGASERPEDYADAMADCASAEGGADALFAAISTARGREVAARVAARTGWGMASDAAGISCEGGALHASRSAFGGAVVDRVAVEGPAVVTVAAGAYEAAGRPATTAVEERAAEVDGRVVRTSVEALPKGDVDLGKAERVVGVGLGFAEEADLSLAEGLADALGAAVGCTRDVAEARGWLPKERYIGITGAQIRPQLYVAVGVSGAMQHVFGVRDAKVVVAVNKAKDAPIFRNADYGIVGDLYDVVPRLTAALK